MECTGEAPAVTRDTVLMTSSPAAPWRALGAASGSGEGGVSGRARRNPTLGWLQTRPVALLAPGPPERPGQDSQHLPGRGVGG